MKKLLTALEQMNRGNNVLRMIVVLGLTCGLTLTAAASNLAVRYCADASGFVTNSEGKVTKVINLGTLGSDADLFPTASTPGVTIAQDAFGSSSAFRFDGVDILQSAEEVKAYADGQLGLGAFYFVVSRSNVSGATDSKNRATFAHGSNATRFGVFVNGTGRASNWYGDNVSVNSAWYDKNPDLSAIGYYKSTSADANYLHCIRRGGMTVVSAGGRSSKNSSGKFVLGGYCSDSTWRLPWNGDIAEVRYYTGGMTASEYFKVTCELAATYDLSIADGATYDFPAALLNGFKNDPAVLGTATGIATDETPSMSASSGEVTAELLDDVAAVDSLVYLAHDGNVAPVRKWVVAGSNGARTSRIRLTFDGAEYAEMDGALLYFAQTGADILSKTSIPVERSGSKLIVTLPAGWASGVYCVCTDDDLVAATCEIWFRADKGVTLGGNGNVVGWKNSGFLGSDYDVCHAKILSDPAAVSTIRYEQNSDQFNARPVVRFVDNRIKSKTDAAGQFLKTAGDVSADFAKDGHTMFAVVEFEDYRYADSFFGFDNQSSGTYRMGFGSNDSWKDGRGWNYYPFIANSSAFSYFHKKPSNAANWQKRFLLTAVTAERSDAGAGKMTVAVNENGVWEYQVQNTSIMQIAQFNQSRLEVGAIVESWGGCDMCGRIAELRFYGRAMTIQEMTQIQMELSARYGLPVETAGATGPADIADHDFDRGVLGNVYRCGALAETVTSWADGALTAAIEPFELKYGASNTLATVSHDGASTAINVPTRGSMAMERTYLISTQKKDMAMTLRFAAPQPVHGETYILMRKGFEETEFTKLKDQEGVWNDGIVTFAYPSGITSGVYRLLRYTQQGLILVVQ